MADLVTLYMPLLDEGVEVWRPVQAEALPNGLYLVHGPMSDDELWQFQPGSIVGATLRQLSEGVRLVAIARPPE